MNTPTIRSIQERTALVFGVPVESMTAKSRVRSLARARQAAMYLAWKLTGAGTSAIGRAFNREHATVHYALQRVPEIIHLDQDHEFARKIALVEESLHDPKDDV